MISLLAIYLLTPGLAWDAVSNATGYQSAWFNTSGVVAFTNTAEPSSPGLRVPAQPLYARVLAFDAYGQTSAWTEPMPWPASPIARTNLALQFALPALQSTDLTEWLPCMERTQEFTDPMRFFRPSRFTNYTVTLPGDWNGGEVWACEQPVPVPPYTPRWVWEWEDQAEFTTLVLGAQYWFYAKEWNNNSQGEPVLIGSWKGDL